MAFQRRHLDLRAQGRLRKADGNPAKQVMVLALEERVLLDAEHDIEVAGMASLSSDFPLPGNAQLAAGINPGRYPELQGFFAAEAPFPAAPAASAASRMVSVPVMFVSTKARRECVAT